MPLDIEFISSYKDRRGELDFCSYHKAHALYSVGKRTYLPSHVCRISPSGFAQFGFGLLLAMKELRLKTVKLLRHRSWEEMTEVRTRA